MMNASLKRICVYMEQEANGLKEEDIPRKIKPWKLVIWDGKKEQKELPYADMKCPVTAAIKGKRCLILAVHSIPEDLKRGFDKIGRYHQTNKRVSILWLRPPDAGSNFNESNPKTPWLFFVAANVPAFKDIEALLTDDEKRKAMKSVESKDHGTKSSLDGYLLYGHKLIQQVGYPTSSAPPPKISYSSSSSSLNAVPRRGGSPPALSGAAFGSSLPGKQEPSPLPRASSQPISGSRPPSLSAVPSGGRAPQRLKIDSVPPKSSVKLKSPPPPKGDDRSDGGWNSSPEENLHPTPPRSPSPRSSAVKPSAPTGPPPSRHNLDDDMDIDYESPVKPRSVPFVNKNVSAPLHSYQLPHGLFEGMPSTME